MPVLDLNQLGEQLRVEAFVHTSFTELGLPIDENLFGQVLRTCPEQLIQFPSDELVRECRAVSDNCKNAARLLMQPIIDVLFTANIHPAIVRRDWRLFGVNYYKPGSTFPPHRDLNNPELATIVVASLCGKRQFRVLDRPPVTVTRGSIVLIDGGINPEHSASCITGPSVSIVADVPALFY